MTGSDWLIVGLLLAVIALLWCLDELADLRQRRIERDVRAAEHRRLMKEVRRQP